MNYQIKIAKPNFENLGYFLLKNGCKLRHFYDKKEALEVKKALTSGVKFQDALKIGFQKTICQL